MIITLVGEHQAKLGHKFLFEKAVPECLKCDLKQVCVNNLEIGRVYEIKKIRRKKHSCKVFEGDAVVVEVDIVPVEALIPRKNAFEAATITYNPVVDRDLPREILKYANPSGLKTGDKCKIIKILEDLTAKNSSYKIAQLLPVLNRDAK